MKPALEVAREYLDSCDISGVIGSDVEALTVLIERQREEAVKEAQIEVCMCAAVRTLEGTVIRGFRHSDCLFKALALGTSKAGIEQGFYTSSARFVSREEGFLLQHKAGIQSVAEGGYRGKQLFSEDLY